MRLSEKILKEYFPEVEDVHRDEIIETLPLIIVDMMEEHYERKKKSDGSVEKIKESEIKDKILDLLWKYEEKTHCTSDYFFKYFDEVTDELVGLLNNNCCLKLEILNFSKLKKGLRIIDSNLNSGTIASIGDIHNVEISFDNGGKSILCFDESCDASDVGILYIKSNK